MKVAILGLGVAGAMTAWRLAQRGHEVYGYERHAAGHVLGSSHGESRVIRRVYPDPYYTRLMSDSYALWREFTQSANDSSLVELNGGIFIGPRDHPDIQMSIESMRDAKASHELLDDAETMRRYPGLAMDRHEVALLDSEMGYARAGAVVAAAQRLAVQHGAKLTLGAAATITTDSPAAIVVNGETHSFDFIVIAAGAWTNDALKPFGVSLPLKVTRQIYINLKSKGETDGKHLFPVWIDANSLHYGFPELSSGAGYKIARHFPDAPTMADLADRKVTSIETEPLLSYASRRIKCVLPEVLSAGTCLYTNTPDEDFVIDHMPGRRDVAVISACSGHGFKFAPLIGEIAAQLACGESVVHDISRFHIARFG